MAWAQLLTFLSTDTFTSRSTTLAAVVNNLTADIHTWGANVDAGANSLVNLGGIQMIVGASAPQSKLFLQGDQGTANPQGPITFSRVWNSTSDTRASAIYHTYNTGQGRDFLAICVSGDGGNVTFPAQTSNIKVVVQANGFVGIGTVSPPVLLTLSQGGSIVDSIRLLNSSSPTNNGWGIGIRCVAEGDLVFRDLTANATRFYINSAGYVGIGSTAPTSPLQVVGLPVYANNAAAAVSLTAGAFYRTGGNPDQVCVVH